MGVNIMFLDFLALQVTLKTLMADPGNRHYFGLNRPEQTGEADSHGFRTSAHADTVPALPTLDPTGANTWGHGHTLYAAFNCTPHLIVCGTYCMRHLIV